MNLAELIGKLSSKFSYDIINSLTNGLNDHKILEILTHYAENGGKINEDVIEKVI